MVNLGIIGCGKITKIRHAKELFECENAGVAGFYDISKDRAKELVDEFGGKVYDDYQDMLRDPEVDGVIICTPNSTHAQMSIEAMQQGKHVLVEKPMATTLEDSERIIKEAEKSDKIIMAAHNQRFTYAHSRAKEIISRGEMGRVLSFRCTLAHPGPEYFSVGGAGTWYLDKKASGYGCISDLGIHRLDIIMYVLGEKISKISGFARTLDKKKEDGTLAEVYDNSVSILSMESGAIGTLNLSYTNYGDWDNSLVLYCEKGVIKTHFYNDCDIEIVMKDGRRIKENQPPYVGEKPNSNIIRNFVKAIEDGGESPVSAKDAYMAMKAIVAIDKSEKTKQCIEIWG
ncbi:MAG: Gfo/Idh/MocA family oxidoreductase [Maledivibacter sp.]|jgi:predicted dehydrogenase|nr:Gfo/Idh/MocA family oxidoreductase [Maledivibacter sp.]